MGRVPDDGEGPRPLRSDARRNRERLLVAARELFAARGLDVPLEDIARRAGVSVGTLYNRFPARADLIEAVFAERLADTCRIAEDALADPDPWGGFVGYLERTCALHAADPGYNAAAMRGVPASPVTERLRARGYRLVGEVVDRAKRAGALRADFVVEDLAFVIWGHTMTVEATGAVAPRLWRRHLGLVIDGLRAAAAHPLPEPPLPPAAAHRVAHRPST